MRQRQNKFGLCAAALQQVWLGDDGFAIRAVHRHLSVRLCDQRVREKRAHTNPSGGKLRCDAGAYNVINGEPFQPNRLPDTGKRAVPALLSERNFGKWRFGKLVRIVNWAVDPDLDLDRFLGGGPD